jgi:tetrahydromethanopterin S-methyltransferase subunit G
MTNGRVTVKEFKAEMMPRIENLETNVTNIHADIGKLHVANTESATRDIEMMGAINELQDTIETAPVMNIHSFLNKEITKKISVGTGIIIGVILGLQQSGLLG